MREPFPSANGRRGVTNPPNGSGFILAVIFISIVGLFGIFTLFVRAENIERTGLVGGLTVLTALIAGLVLTLVPGLSNATLISVSCLSVLGFVVGRVIDALLGPRDVVPETEESVIGADLAD